MTKPRRPATVLPPACVIDLKTQNFHSIYHLDLSRLLARNFDEVSIKWGRRWIWGIPNAS